MQKDNGMILVAVFLVMTGLWGSVEGATWYVDANGGADFNSIQAAIDDASNGDEIEVAPGTYYEAINFNGKGVRLYSSGGADVTTIDGTGHYHVVQCVNGEDANTILEGFTITGGYADAYPECRGGGMYNEDSSPTVTNCTFLGNTAHNDSVYEGQGGGMYNNGGSPTVTGCTFSGNTAESGGGMYNDNRSKCIVTNCMFSGNTAYFTTAQRAGGGGGMFNYNQSKPTVTNCLFVGNLAFNSGGESYGGGMLNDVSSPTLSNCTFSGNKASYGAGLSNYSECVAIVKNCIFWQDETILAPGYSDEIFNHQPDDCYEFPDYIGYSTAIVSYSDIDYNQMFGPGPDASGNIDADPNFIDPGYWDANGTPGDVTDDIWVSGDYHLSAGSPCIDAGSNPGVDIDRADLDGDGISNEVVPLDMDGHARFTDDPNTPDSGVYFTVEFPIVDMGAYEHPGTEPIGGDINGDGAVDFKDLALLCNNWLSGLD